MPTKREIRRQFRSLRAGWSADWVARQSAAIAERLLAMATVAQAPSVFCYLSIPGEVRTIELIRRLLAMQKIVAVPLIDPAGAMQACPITDPEQCRPTPTSHGIPVPRGAAPLTAAPSITLVPGVAFTVAGLRLGRGGGHYDRYLAAHPTTVSVALALDEQIVDELPAEPHDQTMRWIVTPTQMIQTP